jgi:hypothetical protein
MALRGGRARELLPVEAVGFAIAAAAVGVLLSLLPDAQPFDALACLRFYLARGACAP